MQVLTQENKDQRRQGEVIVSSWAYTADAWYGYAAPAAYHHVPAVYAHEETITSPCHEVVSEHCVNNPVVEDTAVPIEQCHVVNKVDCVDEVQKIPKTLCEAVETKVVRHAHPFAYHYGK